MHLKNLTGLLTLCLQTKNVPSLPTLLKNLKEFGLIPRIIVPFYSLLLVVLVYLVKSKVSLIILRYICFVCKWVWQLYLICVVIPRQSNWWLNLFFYLGLAVLSTILIRFARKHVLVILNKLKNKKQTSVLKFQVMSLLMFLLGLELVLIF